MTKGVQECVVRKDLSVCHDALKAVEGVLMLLRGVC